MDIGDRPPRPKPAAASSRSQSTRACIHCQRRKTRCSGNDGGRSACAYCRSAGKLCSFDRRPDRTPLTRQNLEGAKKVGAQLRVLLRTLNPDLDIDAALVALDRQRSSGGVLDSEAGIGGSGGGGGGAALSGSDASPMGEGETALDRYEWQENHRPLSSDGAAPTDNKDGMAILPSVNAGYLGRSSGSDIFQEVAALLPASVILHPNRRESSHSHPQSSAEPRADFDPAWLPSSMVTDCFVDAYFQLYNTSYPILHEATFRAEIADQGRMLSASATWRIIYYMVLAIGHWLSSTSHSLDQCPYYAAARSRVSMQLLETGTTRTIQGFLLMGNFLQKRDRPNTGYNLIGLAHRIAVGIGLHREKTAVEDTVLFERYRQLFWAVYCFDSGFSITTGRPIAAMEGFIDQNLPRNIDDKDCILTSPVPNAVDYPTTYSALIAQAHLAKIANAIYNEFLSARTANRKVEYQIAEMMAHRLDNWKSGLPVYFLASDSPPWFIGPKSIVLWKEQNLRILLWRETKRHHPYLPMHVDSKRRCLEAAIETIHSISSYCTSNESSLHPGIAWYATYFIFQATLVLEASYLSQHSAPSEVLPSDYDNWQVSVAAARRCLEILAKKNNNSASLCLELIGHIHNTSTQFQREAEPGQGEVLGGVSCEGGGGGGDQGGVNQLPDPFAWTSQMDEVVTDPILRTMIDEAFWDFNISPFDAGGQPGGILGQGGMEFS